MTASSSGDSSSRLTVADAVNRGYNTLAAALLGVLGFGFTELIFGEPDPLDKIDNIILLGIGVIAIAWYFTANHRLQRSPVPIGLGLVALIGQILGIFIEINDPAAIGDDFGGLTLYALTLILLIALYSVNRRLAPD